MILKLPRYQNLGRHEGIWTWSAVFGYILSAPMFRSRFSSKLALNAGYHFVNTCLVYYFASSLSHSIFEPKFVSQDAALRDLAQKYNFTIFDFAQAKKEAHLKHLRAELLKETKLEISPQ